MIIDFHTHAFHQPIAQRALNVLSHNASLLPCFDGTPQGLIRSAKQDGIDHCVVLNIATKPQQQTVINDFAHALNQQEGLIAFGSVHPAAPDALDELERIASLGLVGIKFHPDYQHFFVDDPQAIRLYEKASSLGLITVFHSGLDLGLPQPVHCPPHRLRRVLDAFTSPVVAAHLGGYQMFDEVESHLVGTKVYLDTAFLYGSIAPSQAQRIIDNHGADRILFGSDSPWQRPRDTLYLVRSLTLPQPALQCILGDNAAQLLHLPLPSAGS